MKKELIVQRDPKSPISEIFRTLRTNIQFMSSSKELKTIVVTSTLPGEGKSWVSANLAIVFAQAGKKVILIDADMRRGRLYHLFNVPPKPGLSNYLSGVDTANKANIVDYIRETEIDNLFFIPAGNVPPNPSELLISDRASDMIKRLKNMSDIVIFDGTPSLLVTDAMILSRFVDSTIIVTSYNETKNENLEKVKRSIEDVGGKIAGVVLNKIPMTSKKYEDKYYYGNQVAKLSNHNMRSKGSSLKSLIQEENFDTKYDEIEETKQEKTVTKSDTSEMSALKAEELLKQINSYLNDDNK